MFCSTSPDSVNTCIILQLCYFSVNFLSFILLLAHFSFKTGQCFSNHSWFGKVWQLFAIFCFLIGAVITPDSFVFHYASFSLMVTCHWQEMCIQHLPCPSIHPWYLFIQLGLISAALLSLAVLPQEETSRSGEECGYIFPHNSWWSSLNLTLIFSPWSRFFQSMQFSVFNSSGWLNSYTVFILSYLISSFKCNWNI